MTLDYNQLLAEHAPALVAPATAATVARTPSSLADASASTNTVVASPSRPSLKIVGNLPFNVATPLLMRFFSLVASNTGPLARETTSLTLSFQAEVGARLLAPPQASQRGRLSVMAQHYCDVQPRFIIPGRLFVPAPKVDAQVVHLAVKTADARKRDCALDGMQEPDFATIEHALRLLFQQRRKVLPHGVQMLLDSRPRQPRTAVTMDDARAFILDCGLDSSLRPGQLTTAQMLQLIARYHGSLTEAR